MAIEALNDTIAAIVGATVGALAREAWSARPLDLGLSGRTTADDAGKIFDILQKARST